VVTAACPSQSHHHRGHLDTARLRFHDRWRRSTEAVALHQQWCRLKAETAITDVICHIHTRITSAKLSDISIPIFWTVT